MAGLGAAVVLAPMLWRDEPLTGFAMSCSLAGLLIMSLAAWATVEAHYFLPKRQLAHNDLRAGLPELAAV